MRAGVEEAFSASQELVGKFYQRYNAAVLGFTGYWHAVMLSSELTVKPRSVVFMGERIMLIRDNGRAHALRDRCPHRGVPLSQGRQEYPGTITCAYHAWTYDLADGNLVAVLTDSPDSPILGKGSVRVRVYPTEERAGLIWIWPGPDADPPPVERDIPAELLREDAVILGLRRRQKGNWRLAAENGIDEGHARYLHRGTKFSFFREFPAWTRGKTIDVENGTWLARDIEEKVWADVHPAVGRWPKTPARWWQSKDRGARQVAIRMPGILRVTWKGYADYEFYVPSDEHHFISILIAVKWTRGPLRRLAFRLRYWAYIRWLLFGEFNHQDTWMVESMQIPPERLYRPDASVTSWRKLCEDAPFGEPRTTVGA